MATVNYILKGKTDTIYLRFRHKDIDITISTQIYVSQKNWDNKNQKIKNVITVPERDKINLKLAELKIHLISSFNIDFTGGKIIDKQWLQKNINNYYNRPDDNCKSTIYFSEYIKNWIEVKAKKYRMQNGKLIAEYILNSYKQAYINVLDFEDSIKNKIKFEDLDRELFDEIANYLINKMGYAESTTKRRIKRIKFFVVRAEEENIKINNGYKATNYIEKREPEYKHPYLNEKEIDLIFNYKTDDEKLSWVRDNWIIGLWTGLRISDFLVQLNIDNISEDFIEIKNKKTGMYVAIPLHTQVKSVLAKYNGLPPKVTEQEFNEKIKIIAKKLEFNQKMMGGVIKLNKKKQARKHIGMFQKWELMTSHICRRSFCTNLFGKVPNTVIMNVAGWKSEQQMFEYNKLTNKESAMKLKKYWDEKGENKPLTNKDSLTSHEPKGIGVLRLTNKKQNIENSTRRGSSFKYSKK